MREVLGNKLINLRAPSERFKWEGDWRAGSPNWEQRIQVELMVDPNIGPLLARGESTDCSFWMSYSEAVSYFKSLNVCRVQKWNEVRIKGKFLRIYDIEDPYIEVV